MIPWLWLVTAWAGVPRVVTAGETFEQIAAEISLDAAVLRERNGFGAGAQPVPGTILDLPGSNAASTVGVLVSLRGTASVTRPGQRTVIVESASAPDVTCAGTGEVPEGTVVCTSEASYASVGLLRGVDHTVGDVINLLPETCLTLTAAGGSGASRVTRVQLDRGAIGVERPAVATGGVVIETRDAVATAAGGFRVAVEDGATRTEAVYAPVALYGAGAELRLQGGEGSRVRQGSAPDPAVKLPLAPTLTTPAYGAALRRPDFGWGRSDRSVGYFAEVASSADFREIQVRQWVDEPTWTPERLFLPVRGVLYWRVTGVDRAGFEGMPSEIAPFSSPIAP